MPKRHNTVPFAIARYFRFIIHFAGPRLVSGYFFKEKPTCFSWEIKIWMLQGVIVPRPFQGMEPANALFIYHRLYFKSVHRLYFKSVFLTFPCSLSVSSLMVRTLVLNNISIYYLVDSTRCKIISE